MSIAAIGSNATWRWGDAAERAVDGMVATNGSVVVLPDALLTLMPPITSEK